MKRLQELSLTHGKCHEDRNLPMRASSLGPVDPPGTPLNTWHRECVLEPGQRCTEALNCRPTKHIFVLILDSDLVSNIARDA
jgi:hypothetical protein